MGLLEEETKYLYTVSYDKGKTQHLQMLTKFEAAQCLMMGGFLRNRVDIKAAREYMAQVGGESL